MFTSVGEREDESVAHIDEEEEYEKYACFGILQSLANVNGSENVDKRETEIHSLIGFRMDSGARRARCVPGVSIPPEQKAYVVFSPTIEQGTSFAAGECHIASDTATGIRNIDNDGKQGESTHFASATNKEQTKEMTTADEHDNIAEKEDTFQQASNNLTPGIEKT